MTVKEALHERQRLAARGCFAEALAPVALCDAEHEAAGTLPPDNFDLEEGGGEEVKEPEGLEMGKEGEKAEHGQKGCGAFVMSGVKGVCEVRAILFSVLVSFMEQ
jgi:hypothetical protein